MRIIRKKPSGRWGEAFPLGNGHMGAMVYGSFPLNRIELSENTFFSGEKSDKNNQENAAEAFYEMRRLASAGEYDKVHEAAKEFIGIRHDYGTNLPVGSLFIDYGIPYDQSADYQRELDIEHGIAACNFNKENQIVKEELFLSHPDNILIHHIKTDIAPKIKITFQSANEYGEVKYQESAVLFSCHAYEKLHCDKQCGVSLEGYASLVTDGTCITQNDAIIVEGASDIKIYLYMKTDFNTGIPSAKEVSAKLRKEVKKHVLKCSAEDYEEQKLRHSEDISNFMNRVSLHVAGKDELLNHLPLLFQYGRYLLLSSSREDSVLPAHLQGIWNDNVACRIGWSCDMHLDINTQMNYWPSQVTNLSETAEPLFGWIREELAPAGVITAKESYGLKGWVAELVSNAWGFAAPYWASPIAPCPTGGVWIMMQMWEHYLFTEDTKYLEDILFPLLESSVKFFCGYLFQEKEKAYYTCGPSISPENSFLYQGRAYQISNGCTYEMVMIRELLTVYKEACETLQNGKTELYTEVEEKLPKLLPLRITQEGTIAEWNHDLLQADVQHRHTSHLLGLFPFSQITVEKTPDLCQAAKKTIEAKLTPPENWEDTGWARSMLMLYEARLHNGREAYQHIKSMINNLLEPNNMVYHPPTRGAGAFDHVYELDGNTGLTACIAEMLLQSHDGMIRILPALPDEWEEGEVKGLRARGNITVDIIWKRGELHSVRLISMTDKKCVVSYGNKIEEIEIKGGVPYILLKEHNHN